MDIQLKELIERIKNEGVASAESDADAIIKDAKQKAAAIIQEAEKEAQAIVAKAKEEKSKFEYSGKEALKQAGRDLLLNLKTKITELFNKVVEQETATALKPDVMENIIVNMIKNWDKQSVSDLQLLLGQEDLKALESGLKVKLAQELKEGVDIKPFAQIESGFRISEKNGMAYYDFTSQGIAEILSQYLNPRFAEGLRE